MLFCLKVKNGRVSARKGRRDDHRRPATRHLASRHALGEADDTCDATERGSRQTVISSNRRSVGEVTCWSDDLADDSGKAWDCITLVRTGVGQADGGF